MHSAWFKRQGHVLFENSLVEYVLKCVLLTDHNIWEGEYLKCFSNRTVILLQKSSLFPTLHCHTTCCCECLSKGGKLLFEICRTKSKNTWNLQTEFTHNQLLPKLLENLHFLPLVLLRSQISPDPFCTFQDHGQHTVLTRLLD